MGLTKIGGVRVYCLRLDINDLMYIVLTFVQIIKLLTEIFSLFKFSGVITATRYVSTEKRQLQSLNLFERHNSNAGEKKFYLCSDTLERLE